MKYFQNISRFSRLLLFWTTGWVPSRGTYLLGLFHLGLLRVIFRIETMIRNINLQSTELYTPVSRSCPSLLLEVYEKTSVCSDLANKWNEDDLKIYETTHETKWSESIRQFLLVNEVSHVMTNRRKQEMINKILTRDLYQAGQRGSGLF